ncbi:hypothetical protein Gotri_021577, partial [Gossypium trilobum]|nr:hypothetical protein [Gossypium trilobum]
MHLSATEYGPYLQNEPSPLHTTTIVEKCTLKLVDEYKHMLCQATEPLSTFLEYITLVLVDTPLAPYFSECITSEDLDDMNIEIMRNTLYKAYLEDFYKFCQV